jgi:hypothetical protein
LWLPAQSAETAKTNPKTAFNLRNRAKVVVVARKNGLLQQREQKTNQQHNVPKCYRKGSICFSNRSKKNGLKQEFKKIKQVCWVVGFGDIWGGERESVKKYGFSKPFHPTCFSVLFFLSTVL